MKKWTIKQSSEIPRGEEIIQILLKSRGITEEKDQTAFLHPADPDSLTAQDVGIDEVSLKSAIARITKAIKEKESIVVYADYDADGISAGAVMWETIRSLGGVIMPYIPHRVEEGYGFSKFGLENIKKTYDPKLVISVDHGITAAAKIEYAKSLGMEVIVTDHHTKPAKIPDCTIVHTTQLCGAGISWFVGKELLKSFQKTTKNDLLALCAIGTIADMVPLTHANRAIAKYGLEALRKSNRIGLQALYQVAGVTQSQIDAYTISHLLAPRLNASGRLTHALDALRLLCTRDPDKARHLAQELSDTNGERQKLTEEFTLHAKLVVEERLKNGSLPKLLFVAHESYNQGVIGLVAGKLVETYWRPAVVVATGEKVSKASARSIAGFDIIAAIRSLSEDLLEAGGHPMAAGFSIETSRISEFQKKLEELAAKSLSEALLERQLMIDMEIPFSLITQELFKALQTLAPFGSGNFEPVFATTRVRLFDIRQIGKEGKHLKLKLRDQSDTLCEAIGFGMGELYERLTEISSFDVAYNVMSNEWNGKTTIQLRLRDIRFPTQVV
jgi:single-stranded-DNA-specific exonuclease